eukprot:6761026-Pyramimonas_sp.AAC.1
MRFSQRVSRVPRHGTADQRPTPDVWDAVSARSTYPTRLTLVLGVAPNDRIRPTQTSGLLLRPTACRRRPDNPRVSGPEQRVTD